MKLNQLFPLRSFKQENSCAICIAWQIIMLLHLLIYKNMLKVFLYKTTIIMYCVTLYKLRILKCSEKVPRHIFIFIKYVNYMHCFYFGLLFYSNLNIGLILLLLLNRCVHTNRKEHLPKQTWLQFYKSVSFGKLYGNQILLILKIYVYIMFFMKCGINGSLVYFITSCYNFRSIVRK